MPLLTLQSLQHKNGKNTILIIYTADFFFGGGDVSVKPGSAEANGREPKSCLGRVFNFKLGHFVMHAIAWHIQKHALA